MLHGGHEPSAAAAITGCARATVYQTLYRFEELGKDSVFDQRQRPEPTKGVRPGGAHSGRVHRLLAPRPRLAAHHLDAGTAGCPTRAGNPGNRREAQPQPRSQRTAREPGPPRSAASGLRVPIRGRRRTLKKIDRLVKRASEHDEVFYVDEADIDLKPRIGATYMRRGKQLVVLTPAKNVKRYVAGALNARTGKVVYVVAPRKNSDLFVLLLDALRHAYRAARRIHLVLDNYIIHKRWAIASRCTSSRRTRRSRTSSSGSGNSSTITSPATSPTEPSKPSWRRSMPSSATFNPSREPRYPSTKEPPEAVSGTVQAI